MEAFLRDFRYAWRGMRRRPVFSSTVVSILALGIAATACIFSVVNTLVLEPLNYEDPDRLIHLQSSIPKRGIPTFAISTAEYLDYREQSKLFEDIAAYGGATETFNSRRDDEPARLPGRRVTANLFDVLGVRPALGRTFAPDEQGPSSPKVLILSDRLWKREFGADPLVVGGTMLLDEVPHTIIGVLPPGVTFPSSEVEVWLPLELDLAGQSRRIRRFRAVGRLKPETTLTEARAEMAAIASRLEEQYPDSNTDFEAHVVPLYESLFGEHFARTWTVAFASVLVLLLISCANVASLFLTQATVRQRELVIRSTLGASRLQILRQFLAEATSLAALGYLVALAISHFWGISLVTALIPPELPRADAVRLDHSVIAFTGLLTILTAMLSGSLPAILLTARRSLALALSEGGRTSPSRVTNAARTGLVVLQVAFAFSLLVAAGVLIQSFGNLQDLDRGIQTENVLAVRLTVPEKKFPGEAKLVTHLVQILEELRALPGVRSAAAINELPATGYINWAAQFTVDGRPPPPTGQEYICQVRTIGPDYFRTIGIELLAGRDFSSDDRIDEPDVIVINETLAAQHFPTEDAVGKFLSIRGREGSAQIIAVVADVRQAGPREPIRPSIYYSYRQRPPLTTSLVVRTENDPTGLVPAIRSAVAAVDNSQALYSIETVEQALSEDVAQERALARLFTALVAAAVLLSAAGLYGVVAYTMAQRTREIGIRVALGAGKGDVARLVVLRGLSLTLIGLLVGLGCTVAANPMLTPLLFEVDSFDPRTIVVVSLILVGVSLLAMFFPARRAASIDPLEALRFE